MDYVLAKELKDAGFPQKPYLEVEEKTIRGSNITVKFAPTDNVTYSTLSELIEACGMTFHSLIRTEKGWDACEWVEPFSDNFASRVSGSSPEEAVARLWLALHKK